MSDRPGLYTHAHMKSAVEVEAAVARVRGRPVFTAWRFSLILMLAIAGPCVVTLPWSIQYYDVAIARSWTPPGPDAWLGTDQQGRSLLWRCLLGGAVSLGIGLAAATVAVIIGVLYGCIAGARGGQTDATMMRGVDVLYGLPYILLVVLIDMAIGPPLVPAVAWTLSALESVSGWAFGRGWTDAIRPTAVADVLSLLIAIGVVSWLTLARVIRGQVLSLRRQPFMEAARAFGTGPWRMLRWHLLPNLTGPIIVYTTLTIPTAILQESFLSFLGIGVQELPSWGRLASDGMESLHALGRPGAELRWWLIVWPCLLLGLTLMALNLLGDALRDRLDPRSVK